MCFSILIIGKKLSRLLFNIKGAHDHMTQQTHCSHGQLCLLKAVTYITSHSWVSKAKLQKENDSDVSIKEKIYPATLLDKT